MSDSFISLHKRQTEETPTDSSSTAAPPESSEPATTAAPTAEPTQTTTSTEPSSANPTNPSIPSTPTIDTTTSSVDGIVNSETIRIALISAGCLVGLIIICIAACCIARCRRKRNRFDRYAAPPPGATPNSQGTAAGSNTTAPPTKPMEQPHMQQPIYEQYPVSNSVVESSNSSGVAYAVAPQPMVIDYNSVVQQGGPFYDQYSNQYYAPAPAQGMVVTGAVQTMEPTQMAPMPLDQPAARPLDGEMQQQPASQASVVSYTTKS